MFHAGKTGFVAGTDHLRMVAGGHGAERRHNTLVIHQHHFHRPRGEHQFRHQVIARHGDPMAHQKFIAGAADAGKIDPTCAFFFCQGDHVRGFTGL